MLRQRIVQAGDLVLRAEVGRYARGVGLKERLVPSRRAIREMLIQDVVFCAPDARREECIPKR